MAKSKHSFAKRQRELDKKKKQEEKRQRKLAKNQTPPKEGPARQLDTDAQE